MAALCGALCVGACSGGSAASSAHHSSAGEPASGPAAAAVVKDHWLEFFNGAAPIPRRLKLLQDNGQFASWVHAEEKTSLGSLVLAASATVSSVKVAKGQASVVYTILLGGKPLEKNITGAAVYTGGHWQIARSTFCGLLYLAYGKTSRQIPRACAG